MSYEQDKDGYVNFGDVSRNEFKMQCQYGCCYVVSRDVYGCEDEPNLGKGLRFKNLDVGAYHNIMIHIDDIPELVRRYKEWKKENDKIHSGSMSWLHKLFFSTEEWEKEYENMLCGGNIPRWKKKLFFRS
jgi:hypothetical protein